MLWVVGALLVAVIARAVNLRTSRSPSRLGESWVGRTATEARTAAGDLVAHPARLALLIACTAAAKASNLLALYAALWAFGGDVATWRVAVVYLVGATAAEIVPTPAGLGTVDAALIAGLVTTGVGGGATLAAVIVVPPGVVLGPDRPWLNCLGDAGGGAWRCKSRSRHRYPKRHGGHPAADVARRHRPVARTEQGRPHRRPGRHRRGSRDRPTNHRRGQPTRLFPGGVPAAGPVRLPWSPRMGCRWAACGSVSETGRARRLVSLVDRDRRRCARTRARPSRDADSPRTSPEKAARPSSS